MRNNSYQKLLKTISAQKMAWILFFFGLNCLGNSGLAQESKTIIQHLSGTGYQDTEEWEFKLSHGRNSGEWTTINVPSVWEQEGFGKYQYGVRFYGQPHPEGIADEVGMYKYHFDVPKEWENKRVRIVFEGAMTDTEVKINGRSAGSKHQGGFYRFRYDITELLKFGEENLLEATVSKESENASVNLAERRADYWNFGGIFRPVFLEVKPARFIERTAIDARHSGEFYAEVFLGDGFPRGLTVKAKVKDAKGNSLGSALESELAPGSDKMVLKQNFENISPWTAETPNLYDIHFALYDGDELVHETEDRFGFRTMEVKESDGIYINGQRVILKGVNKHSFWPESGRTLNKELNYEAARLIKEMNMNAVRLSHYPSDPEFLDACDELGLYVLHELAGWHGKYDEDVGRPLVESLVMRDVNHPSVIFWDNGNEGGWNPELDDEFGRWDPQDRPVLHPQQLKSGIETMHYRSYGETQEYMRGDYIYMPTEFLHGLYDGGHGAGLDDYWELMREHPRFGGGFLWVFADEGVVRTDQDGRIDNQGNFAADGILGPHHEKEGSFFTIKEVWSPVMIMEKDMLTDSFEGEFSVENRYDFTNLNECSFEWALAKFPMPGDKKAGHRKVDQGSKKGPDIGPQEKGTFSLSLPKGWRENDVLYLSVKDPFGNELWKWSYTWDKEEADSYLSKGAGEPSWEESEESIQVKAGDLHVIIKKEDGKIADLKVKGKAIPFGKGPRFIAARRGDRTLDGTVDPEAGKGIDRVYKAIDYEAYLKNIAIEREENTVKIVASYFGPLKEVVWTIHPGGLLQLDYTYSYDGVVELAGVDFEFPEEYMKEIRFLGDGPYRVWQNRLHGTTLDVWENEYNDPIPGETFEYPEFKGYFANWRWAAFETEQGRIYISQEDANSYLGVYTPRDGRDKLLYTLPETGLGVFDVIPAVRNKVNATDLVGPSSQAQWMEGPTSHTLFFKIETD
ncbi:glycoside hydrolase family 2 protein [Pleomorphovibrio marinus]|uniref:glycoside hydrolase family 2 protein n=1 Tax=Pleomorphovibrio marinus TaxID=2164132 RepID=UPI001E342A03|nr:glycoside hydrolase family 2 TIM barrel-domain containing protein [Pleomorphovibrio marinus]